MFNLNKAEEKCQAKWLTCLHIATSYICRISMGVVYAYVHIRVFFTIKSVIKTLCILETQDWLQSLKQLFINVSYHIRVASLTLMVLLFLSISTRLKVYDMTH